MPLSGAPAFDAIRFTLTIDGAVRQRGDTALLLRPIPLLLAQLDRWYGLEAGDLVFTGTPEGVGPIASKNVLELALDGVPAAGSRFVVA